MHRTGFEDALVLQALDSTVEHDAIGVGIDVEDGSHADVGFALDQHAHQLVLFAAPTQQRHDFTARRHLVVVPVFQFLIIHDDFFVPAGAGCSLALRPGAAMWFRW